MGSGERCGRACAPAANPLEMRSTSDGDRRKASSIQGSKVHMNKVDFQRSKVVGLVFPRSNKLNN